METVFDFIKFVENLPGWFRMWGVIGFFACIGTKVPQNKPGALLYLIAHGPILWVIFPFVSLGYFIERISKTRGGAVR